MFSVPGWSVSAEKLQTEKDESSNTKSKKRKRKYSERDDVDLSNVEELWERHIRGKGKPKKSQKTSTPGKDSDRKKGRNKTRKQDGPIKHQEKGPVPPQDNQTGIKSKERERGTNTQGKHTGKLQNGVSSKEKDTESTTTQTISIPKPPSPQPQEPKLTPLQAQMRQKLISSRFRYLNETLYTTSSSSSQSLFTQNPTFFSEYHEGFRRQVAAWPENPIDGFTKWLLERGKIKAPRDNPRFPRQRDKRYSNKQPEPLTPNSPPPLPRNASAPGVCTVADLGCGEARLAQQIRASAISKKGKLDVKSYDLAASNSFVTVADISALPLQDSSVDIAIFCLALMGTNWIDFVEEAYRILRWKGECWVAEVTSRFGLPKKKGERVEHSVGNNIKDKGGRKGKSKKGREEEEDVDGEERLGFAEETTAQPQVRVDTSAFVAVLRRRGFELQGMPETENKMFVRMRFVKSLPALRGKCAQERPRQSFMPRFIDRKPEEISVEEERKVLKPCVYKTR